MRRIAEGEIRQRVERVAATLHIESKLQRKATALSGGEMQRVAIGRALVREPRVYLMDEPLSSLDAKLREELRVELKRLQRQSGATVVYVTHDQVEATTLADRIAILEAGRIQQVGTPEEIYKAPASRAGGAAPRFAGRSTCCRRTGSPAQHPAAAASVGIRPEDVELAGEGEGFECTVIESSLLMHHVIAEHGGVEVRARLMHERCAPSPVPYPPAFSRRPAPAVRPGRTTPVRLIPPITNETTP